MGRWLVVAALMLGACAAEPRNLPLAPENFRADYGYRHGSSTGEALPRKHIIVTFSGGGTRAAALAEGVLRELAATPVAAGRSLADEIDILSSVSGGSVTAANFALRGADGFVVYERDFLRRNVMADLIGGVLNPGNVLSFSFTSESRIDLLVDVFDRTTFRGATFADLMARPNAPLLILNAADMSSGLGFTFTQSQFDLICSDLSSLPIATAVAASAAYPVGLTPLTLTNYSLCPAQQGGNAELVSRIDLAVGDVAHTEPYTGDGIPRSSDDVLFVTPDRAMLPGRSVGLRREPLFDRAETKGFIHLLDGGIADNLGLSKPLELVFGSGEDGGFGDRLSGALDELVFIVVNARSDPTSSRDRSVASPGLFDMALASIGAAIDGRSTGLEAELSLLPLLPEALKLDPAPTVRIVAVDFGQIRQPACRTAFYNVPTNWNLDDHVVDALMELGAAMVRASPDHNALIAALGGAVRPDPDEAWPGQARAARACRRLTAPLAEPVRFGNLG